MNKKIVFLVLSIVIILSNITPISSLKNETGVVQIEEIKYDSISHALDASNPGDTITIGSGVYNEIIKITKNDITIKGANSGKVSTDKNRIEESEIKAISIDAPNTTIDGVKLTDILHDDIINSKKQSVYIKNKATNTTIKNSIFQLSEYILNHNAIRAEIISEDISIENNTFENYEDVINLEHECKNIQLNNNKLINNKYGFIMSNVSDINILENEFINTVALKFKDNYINQDINANIKNNKFISSPENATIYVSKGNLDITKNYWGIDNPKFESLIKGSANSKPYYQDEDMQKLSDEVYSISFKNYYEKIKLNEQVIINPIIEVGNEVDERIKWESSNPEIATVNDEGNVTGISIGEADITAKIGKKDATCTISVEDEIKVPIEPPVVAPVPPQLPVEPPISPPTQINPIMTDINDHWAKYEIQKFVDKGYINGYLDKTFRPENEITRAEFVKIVNRVFRLSDKIEPNFTDIKLDEWYYDEICIAVKSGYINGYPDKTFRPDEPILREEAALIMTNLTNLIGDGILEFKDIDSISIWAKPSIDKLSDNKIMFGYPDKTFRPKGKMKRSEAVVVLNRIK